jgi:N-acetyl-alpha-D-glucosaminyl L-malate synthase BshA
VEAFGVKREIEVIPNFVNCDVYTPLSDEARSKGRSQFAEAGEKILLHLSNFRPVKRAIDVVEIFARVAREIPARLLMVGDGPDRSQAEWLARRLGIQDRIHFLGKQAGVSDLLPLADLMVMPSELESFGLAALESMACRVPAIATAVGGVTELIEDGVDGRLFAVGDVEGMARASIDLLSDSAKYAAMACEARKTAQKRYCASRIIPQYEAYYERVLERDKSV